MGWIDRVRGARIYGWCSETKSLFHPITIITIQIGGHLHFLLFCHVECMVFILWESVFEAGLGYGIWGVGMGFLSLPKVCDLACLRLKGGMVHYIVG